MKSLMKKEKKEKRVKDLTTEETISLNAVSIYDLAERSILVAPQEKPRKPLPKVSGMGKGSWLADGTFTWMKTPWHKTSSILIKKTNHGKLVKTKDGFIRAYLGSNLSDGEDFAEILREEAEEMAMALEMK